MDNWYVRVRGRILGPFGSLQLREMRERGQLQPFFEVSTDRITWQTAGSVDGVFSQTGVTHRIPEQALPQGPLLSPQGPPAALQNSRNSLGVVLIVGGVLGLIAVLVVVVCVLVVNSANNAPSSGVAISSESNALSSRSNSAVSTVPVPVNDEGSSGSDESSKGPVPANPVDTPNRNSDSNALPAGLIRFNENTTLEERFEKMKYAVGFVVCGLHVTEREGNWFEVPYFSGSCFAVAQNGYLLTNKHVIQAIDNANRSRVIFRATIELEVTSGRIIKPHLREGYELKLNPVEKGQPVTADVFYKYKDMDETNGSTTHPTVWVFFTKSQRYPAEIKYISANYDLAVLKINRSANQFFSLNERATQGIIPGLEVTTWGFPGLQDDALKVVGRGETEKPNAGPVEGKYKDQLFEPIPETGKVRAKPYSMTKGHGGLQDQFIIDHTANISHGNSGGPLILADGSVIGINTYSYLYTTSDDLKKFNWSIAVRQKDGEMRREIDANVPGVVWR